MRFRCDYFIKQEFHVMTEINPIIINGICATKEWKKALEFQKPTSQSLNILIRKALRENELDLVWNLLTKLAEVPQYYQFLASKTILNFVKHLEKHPNSISEDMEKFLSICEDLKIVLNEECAIELTKLLHRSGYHAKITTMDFS